MKVIVFGIGDLARQLDYYLMQENQFEIEYFCVTKEYFSEKFFLGKEVIIFEDEIDRLSKEKYKFIIGTGYRNLRARKHIFNQIKTKGYELINYIHPTVKVYGEILGEGNIILPGVIIEPFVKIYNNNIIWSNNLICHDSIIGNHNFIAANCIIGGFSKVSDNNFLGFNTTVKDNVKIGTEVLVGAKSLILSQPNDYSVYFGAPAKKIREHFATGIQIQ